MDLANSLMHGACLHRVHMCRVVNTKPGFQLTSWRSQLAYKLNGIIKRNDRTAKQCTTTGSSTVQCTVLIFANISSQKNINRLQQQKLGFK